MPPVRSMNNNLHKRLLEPHRLRRVPSQFSWVDHRLVRQNHLPRAAAAAWGLYLVLVTVGDEQGLSYYADRTLCRLLSLSTEQLAAARAQLLAAGVLAYEAPLYQVLGLEVAP
jgi:hypothetical protein